MIRKILVFALAISTAIYLWQLKLTSTTPAPLYDQVADYVKDLIPTKTESNFSESVPRDIVSKINAERIKSGLKELVWSDDLTKAAKARSAVIGNLDDFTGTISGLTREKAYELVDYETTYYGDLQVYLRFETDDFMKEILESKLKKEMILLSKFTEVGVAEVESGEYKTYYLLFGDRRPKVVATVTPKIVAKAKINWGGPELWEAVNSRRVEFGVNKLTRKDELCTIASIRLNQLLDLNKLDGHAGFKPVLDRSDLKWISEKYNISEFLAQGYGTPAETVKGWENTLGHRGLLTGGEYVWGCVYSQNSFAVAIAAY